MCCSLYTSFLGCSLLQGTGRGESIARQKIKVCLCEKSIFLVCGACACACVWCVCMVARACAAFFSPGMVYLFVCILAPFLFPFLCFFCVFSTSPPKKKHRQLGQLYLLPCAAAAPPPPCASGAPPFAGAIIPGMAWWDWSLCASA